MEILTFEQFEKAWWDEHPALVHTELGSNGQFDDIPYELWGQLMKGGSGGK